MEKEKFYNIDISFRVDNKAKTRGHMCSILSIQTFMGFCLHSLGKKPKTFLITVAKLLSIVSSYCGGKIIVWTVCYEDWMWTKGFLSGCSNTVSIGGIPNEEEEDESSSSCEDECERR